MMSLLCSCANIIKPKYNRAYEKKIVCKPNSEMSTFQIQYKIGFSKTTVSFIIKRKKQTRCSYEVKKMSMKSRNENSNHFANDTLENITIMTISLEQTVSLMCE